MPSHRPESGELLLSKEDQLRLPVNLGQPQWPDRVSSRLLDRLFQTANATSCGLSFEEFCEILRAVGQKHNFNLPPGRSARTSEIETFVSSLQIRELALAQACAIGHAKAWEQFLRDYRGFLTQTATTITRSSSAGEELAESLYAELYGLRQKDGTRLSPLASYSGRGSLQGWLRTTLVQRFCDHHRRSRHEEPLEDIDPAAPEAAPQSILMRDPLAEALKACFKELPPEGRFLLVAYYLDQQTLLQIATTLAVHEATISRRIGRLVKNLRKELVSQLKRRGLSAQESREALEIDPRDLEINLKELLQGTQVEPFLTQEGSSSGEPR